VMLKDSAFIQEKDAAFINKKHRDRKLPPVEPLYTQEDVDATLPLLEGAEYSTPFPVSEGIECRFEDAGHILGSAVVALTLRENSHSTRLVFTGDLGRPNLPILRDPARHAMVSFLILSGALPSLCAVCHVNSLEIRCVTKGEMILCLTR